MKKLTFLSLLFLNSFDLFAQEEIDFTQISIDKVTYSGEGCPAGSAEVSLKADKLALAVKFDQFVSETRGDTQLDFERVKKSCRLEVSFNVPENWSYSVFYLTHNGFASLQQESIGTQNTFYTNDLSQRPVTIGKLRMFGPYEDTYSRVDQVPLSQVRWSPCNSSNKLIINSVVGVTSQKNSIGLMSLDSIDGSIEHQYGLVWKKCSAQAITTSKYHAYCKVPLKTESGKVIDTVFSQSQGLVKEATELNARNILQKKCNHRRWHLAACDESEIACSVENL